MKKHYSNIFYFTFFLGLHQAQTVPFGLSFQFSWSFLLVHNKIWHILLIKIANKVLVKWVLKGQHLQAWKSFFLYLVNYSCFVPLAYNTGVQVIQNLQNLFVANIIYFSWKKWNFFYLSHFLIIDEQKLAIFSLKMLFKSGIKLSILFWTTCKNKLILYMTYQILMIILFFFLTRF